MSTEKPNYTLLMLARKWLAGKITVEEKAEFDQWYNSFDDTHHELTTNETEQLMESRIQKEILAKAGIAQTKTIRLWSRIGIAAAAIIGMAIGVYFYTSRHLEGSGVTRDLLNYANDIAPGKNTAILTVNGKQVQLSDAMTGVIVGNDKITYNNGSAIAGTAAKTLTVTTPRGGTYQITLPDGTKVWLNADSKLEFPSRFDKNVHRIVKLIGEGYFEVAKDARRPFRVVSQGQQVTVLGTHFNISAYTGERIRTTLLEGSVSVRHLEGSIGTRDLLNNTNRRSLPAGRDEGPGVILKPNQQSLLTENSGITVKEVNPEDAIDWKSGYFMFNNESLESGLKRIARWYNVQIVYEDENLKGETFFGRISKFEKISKVFSMLERTDVVRFKIEGNKIFVRKKK